LHFVRTSHYSEEIDTIERCVSRRQALVESASFDELIDLDLEFHTAIMVASHNVLFKQLDLVIRQPFRTALSYTSRLSAALALGLEARRSLVVALRGRDPLTAKNASEEIVGIAMLAVEKVIVSQRK
jgi:DNA-binding FadR family transcriptional regulator